MAASSWPPTHVIDRPAAERVKPVAGDDKAYFPSIESDGARIIGIDVEVKASWREAFRFRDQLGTRASAPEARRDNELIDVPRALIDRDKADHAVKRLGDYDLRGRHQVVAPLAAPP